MFTLLYCDGVDCHAIKGFPNARRAYKKYRKLEPHERIVLGQLQHWRYTLAVKGQEAWHASLFSEEWV